jgi:hypothetical protein
MTMNKTVAQVRISRELAEAEASLNVALLKQSQLFATMIAARQETGVSPALGQDLLLRLTKAQQTMLNAGGDLARVHGGLLSIGRDMNLVTMEDNCPDNNWLLRAAETPADIAA